MIREITLRHYGGSLGATLPKAMADRLNLARRAPEPEVVRVTLGVAAGELSEEELAAWVRDHLTGSAAERFPPGRCVLTPPAIRAF